MQLRLAEYNQMCFRIETSHQRPSSRLEQKVFTKAHHHEILENQGKRDLKCFWEMGRVGHMQRIINHNSTEFLST